MPNNVIFLPSDGNGIGLKMKETGWTGIASNQLKNVATYLPTLDNNSDDIASGSDVSIDEFSIPSPWARLIMFETALTNPGLKTLNELIKGEWRGLLAAIALRDIRGLDIQFEEIQLSSLQGRLGQVLKKNRPTNFLFDIDRDWEKLYMVVLKQGEQKHTIGILSNSTMVCTPYEYSFECKALLESKLKWFDLRQGTFKDPVGQMDIEYAKALYLWLGRIRNEVYYSASHNDVLQSSIIRELDSFIGDIRSTYDVNSNNSFQLEEASNGYQGVRQLFDFRLKALNQNQSDLAVFNNKNCIIVSRKMWNIEPRQNDAERIRVFETITLKDIPNSFTSKCRTFGTYSIPPHINIYNADELLLNEIHIIRNETADGIAFDDHDAELQPSGYSSVLHFKDSKYSVIWPISKLIFDFMTVDELKNSIKVKTPSPNEIEVSIKLKLTGPQHLRKDSEYLSFEIIRKYTDDQNNSHDVTKLRNGKIITNSNVDNLPVLAIWPHRIFKYEQKNNEELNQNNIWKRYYTFINENKYSKYIFTPEYKNAEKQAYEYYKPNQFSTNRMIFSTAFPEYALVQYENPDDSDRKYDIGVTFFKKPLIKIIDQSKAWTVGLDFGTTSTTAFYDDGQKKDFITFGRRFEKRPDGMYYSDLSDPYDLDHVYYMTLGDKMVANEHFLPHAYLNKNIYLSLYQNLRDTLPNEHSTELKSFSDGHVFFHNSHNPNEKGEKASPLFKTIYKNLKWGNENETKAARKYMMQILLQITERAASEGVGEINWRLSYPAALSYERRKAYLDSVMQSLNKLNEDTGIKMNAESIINVTESRAASLFFRNIEGALRPLPNEAFVCIDIGGATSDISIWQSSDGTENKLQSSIKYASRNIFLETMEKFPEVMNKLSLVNDALSDSDLLSKISWIEYKLAEEEERIKGIKVNLLGEESYKEFVKLIAFGFSGILYYTTMQLAYLFETGNLQNVSIVKIFLSGNGSKIYQWMTDAIQESTLELKLAERLQKYGVQKVKVIFDVKSLKTEAALGLLYHDENVNRVTHHNERLIAGEDFLLKHNGKDTVSDWITDLSAEDILKDFYAGLIDIKPTKEFQHIKEFVKFYNELFGDRNTGAEFKLGAIDLNILYGKIEDKINTGRAEKQLDPIFILGIKSLLEKRRDEKK